MKNIELYNQVTVDRTIARKDAKNRTYIFSFVSLHDLPPQRFRKDHDSWYFYAYVGGLEQQYGHCTRINLVINNRLFAVVTLQSPDPEKYDIRVGVLAKITMNGKYSGCVLFGVSDREAAGLPPF